MLAVPVGTAEPEIDQRRLRRLEGPIALIAVLVVQVAYLLPVLRTGWLYDDAYHYTLKWEAAANGESFFTYGYASMLNFARAGRFFPLWFFQGLGVFYVVHDAVVYKALLLLLTALASTLVWLLLRRLGMAGPLAALAVLVATACIQLRTYHDSILGFAGVMQFLVIEICLGLILFVRWLEDGGRLRLLGSCALFAVACTWYELAYVMCLLFVGVALTTAGRTWRQRLLAASPFVAIATVFTGTALLVRRAATVVFPGYEPSLSPSVAARTFFHQELGALPGSYQLHPGNGGAGGMRSLVESASLVTWGLAAVAATLALVLVLRSTTPIRPGLRLRLAVVGAGLVVLPALPLAIAGKYQRELTIGVAYIPVFMEVFGIGLLCAVALDVLQAVGGKRPRVLAFALALLIALGTASAFAVDRSINTRTIVASRRLDIYRESNERSLRAGLLADVADGSRVYVEHPWMLAPGFFARFADRRVEVLPVGDSLQAVDAASGGACTPSAPAVYEVVSDPPLSAVTGSTATDPHASLSLRCLGAKATATPEGIRGF